MSCHAIQITIEVLGQNVETMVSAYSWYVGNRPAFQFDYDGVTYQIDWDGIRWCLYNTDTGQLEYVNYSQAHQVEILCHFYLYVILFG